MIQTGISSQTQSMPLVMLAQENLLRLVIPVPESAVSKIRLGGSVEVSVSALGKKFPGKVARFADQVDMATRTMHTEVDVPNPGLVLIPGMYAEVNLTLDRRNRAVTVPIPAIDFGNDESSGQAVVVTSENRVEIRKLQLGIQTAASVEIRSGLQEGDLVVTGNRSSLHAGELVRPKLVGLASPTTP